MLEPNKYTNIKSSVISVVAEMFLLLKSQNFQRYGELLGKIVKQKGENAKSNFPLALIFLFSIGRIQYHQDADVIELLDNN